jgi:hypothetical protein
MILWLNLTNKDGSICIECYIVNFRQIRYEFCDKTQDERLGVVLGGYLIYLKKQPLVSIFCKFSE